MPAADVSGATIPAPPPPRVTPRPPRWPARPATRPASSRGGRRPGAGSRRPGTPGCAHDCPRRLGRAPSRCRPDGIRAGRRAGARFRRDRSCSWVSDPGQGGFERSGDDSTRPPGSRPEGLLLKGPPPAPFLVWGNRGGRSPPCLFLVLGGTRGRSPPCLFLVLGGRRGRSPPCLFLVLGGTRGRSPPCLFLLVHPPFDEFRRPALVVEPDVPQVPEPGNELAGRRVVRPPADEPDVAVDPHDLVAERPGPRLVLPIEPPLHDPLPASPGPAMGCRVVGSVLGEQGADVVRIVRLPRPHVT